jgi:hypothetical protein
VRVRSRLDEFTCTLTTVVYAVAGRRAIITLNRPDRLNAVDGRMPAEIAGGLHDAPTVFIDRGINQGTPMGLEVSVPSSSAPMRRL